MVLIGLYFGIAIFTIYGIFKNSGKSKTKKPYVSIVVAAKDEAILIKECLDSLKCLDYPENKIEYILINDRSRDNTLSLMENFSKSVRNVKIISIKESSEKYSGKTNALIRGAYSSKGDILLFTDADCILPEQWVNSLISKLNAETGIIGGFLVLDRGSSSSTPLFHSLQSLDWIYLTTFGMAWANLNLPLSLFGNNFAVKRDIYFKSGGFDVVKDHFTEDFALMKSITSHTGTKVKIILDDKCAVYTHPADNFKSFYHQRKRWAAGLKKRGFQTHFFLLVSFISRLLLPLLVLTNNSLTALTGFLSILFLDLLIIFFPLYKLKRLHLLKHLLLFEIYFSSYILFFILSSIFSNNIIWKSIKYNDNTHN